MFKFFKILSIAAAGIAIGTVASKLVRTEKVRIFKNSEPAKNQRNQHRAENGKDGRKDSDDDLENCFI